MRASSNLSRSAPRASFPTKVEGDDARGEPSYRSAVTGSRIRFSGRQGVETACHHLPPPATCTTTAACHHLHLGGIGRDRQLLGVAMSSR